MTQSKQVSEDIPDEVTVHHGVRSTDDVRETGRREVARTVLVPESDEYEVIQLLYSLETYKDNRAMKNYTLYIDKQKGDDRRTKSRVTEKTVKEDRKGILRVGTKEVNQFCKEFAHSGDPTQYWK